MAPRLSLALGLLSCQDRSSSSLIASMRAVISLSFFRWTQLRPSSAWPIPRSSPAVFSINNRQWSCAVCDWPSIGGDGSSANARVGTRTAIKTTATATPQKVLGTNGPNVLFSHRFATVPELGEARLIPTGSPSLEEGRPPRPVYIAIRSGAASARCLPTSARQGQPRAAKAPTARVPQQHLLRR
jgi:hypothetical protein